MRLFPDNCFRSQLCLGYGALYEFALSFLLPQIFNFAFVIPFAFFDDFICIWQRVDDSCSS